MSSLVLAASRRSMIRSCNQLLIGNAKQLQAMQRLQQRRQYWFVPTTWAEARERFTRWTENAEQRTIRVQLVQQQEKETLLQQQHHESQRRAHKWYRRPVESPMSPQQISDPAFYRQQKRLKYRRRKLQQHLKAENSITAAISVATEATQLPIYPTARIRLRDRMRQWTRQKFLAVMEGNNTTGQSARFIRDRYRYWTSRQQDRYRGWKLRRQEQWKEIKSSSVATMDRSMTTNVRRLQRMMLRAKNRTNRMLRPIIWRTKHVTLTEYSRPEWFDALGRPLTSRDSTGRFVNPWSSQSTNGVQDLWKIIAWKYLRINRHISETGFLGSLIPRLSFYEKEIMPPTTEMDSNASPKHQSLPLPLPVIPSENETASTSSSDLIQTTWVGHSTCWVQLGGFSVLTDPMFSLRASPFQNLPIGVPREIPTSHTIPELLHHYQLLNCPGQTTQSDNKVDDNIPDIQYDKNVKLDICCITHDHYDHMDTDTTRALKDHVSLWVVPLGIKEWLIDECDIDPDSIIELEWWQHTNIVKTTVFEEGDDGDINTVIQVLPEDISNNDKASDNATQENEIQQEHRRRLTITCCPASHWGGRSVWDRNTRLWCSFAMKDTTPATAGISSDDSDGASFFFCGDTGLPQFPIFSQIGDALGPFDFAALPIGAYEPRFMNQEAHIDPYEALQVHFQINAKKSLGVHWGSFPLSEEGLDDPPRRLQDELQSEFTRLVEEHKKGQQASSSSSLEQQQNRFPTLPSLDFVTIGHGETIQVPVGTKGTSTATDPTIIEIPAIIESTNKKIPNEDGDENSSPSRDP